MPDNVTLDSAERDAAVEALPDLRRALEERKRKQGEKKGKKRKGKKSRTHHYPDVEKGESPPAV